MKNIIFISAVIAIAGFVGFSDANEFSRTKAIDKLATEYQFDDRQKELLTNIILSGKVVRESFSEVSDIRNLVKHYLLKDEMKADDIIADYRQWQQQFDNKLYQSLKDLEQMHSSLTKEQKQALVDDITDDKL